MNRLQQQIENKIRSSTLNPQYLEVVNESNKHNVPPDSESHFKVIVVSSLFDGQPLIKRHRLINEILAHELSNNIHALALRTLTPQEWNQKNQQTPPTPPCLGGSKQSLSKSNGSNTD